VIFDLAGLQARLAFCALARRAPPPFRGGTLPSLNQLLAAHPVVLLLDSASARVQAALWPGGGAAPLWSARDAEAGTGLFACVEELLDASGRSIADVNAFIFCEGPGSVLGVRTASAALRAWGVLNPAPVYSYKSLAVAGCHEWGKKEWRNFTVIADARRDSWHCVEIDADCRMKNIRRVPTGELPQTELFMPKNFRTWTARPQHLQLCSYSLAEILPSVMDGEFFQRCDAPDAFLHEEPSYATWTPHVHQAPA
jgi:tRNA threonylcarbamoyladenosine biosynthesis protein TsaB